MAKSAEICNLTAVTHEEDIAQHARRIIRLRDGVIESDTVNPHPAMEI